MTGPAELQPGLALAGGPGGIATGRRYPRTMADTPAPTLDARDSAISRLRSKRAFMTTVVSYLVLNAFLWGIWAFSGGNDGDGGVPWPLWVTGFGALGLLAHAWSTYGERPIRESDIEREMRRGA